MSKHVYGAVLTAMGVAANNRAESEGNVTQLPKVLWAGRQHTTVSSEAIRWGLRSCMQGSGHAERMNRTWEAGGGTPSNAWKDPIFARWEGAGEKFVDDDLLGFMSATAAKAEGGSVRKEVYAERPTDLSVVFRVEEGAGSFVGQDSGVEGAVAQVVLHEKPDSKNPAHKRALEAFFGALGETWEWVAEDDKAIEKLLDEAGKNPQKKVPVLRYLRVAFHWNADGGKSGKDKGESEPFIRDISWDADGGVDIILNENPSAKKNKALREALAGFEFGEDGGEWKKMAEDDKAIEKLLGEAAKKPKGTTLVRRSRLEVAPAVSLSPWNGEVTFNAASIGATPSAAKKGNNPVLYGTEIHATRYQYAFSLTPGDLADRGRAELAIDGLMRLRSVGGNHARFLFDFSPDVVVFRVTDDMSPRILYCFDDAGKGGFSLGRLVGKIAGGDIDGREVVVGGVVGDLAEALEAVGVRVCGGVLAAAAEVRKRIG